MKSGQVYLRFAKIKQAAQGHALGAEQTLDRGSEVQGSACHSTPQH